MGIIRDILDTAKELTTLKDMKVNPSKRYSSISKRSLEGTLQFPTLVSKSIDIDTAQMISKALERQYGSFVQTTLSMSPFLDISKDGSAAGYLKKFHQNDGVKTDKFDVYNTFIDIAKEHYDVSSNESESIFLFATICEGSTAKLVAANKQQLTGVMESIREDVLNDKFIPRNLYQFKNKNLSQHHNQIVTEASRIHTRRGVNRADLPNGSNNVVDSEVNTTNTSSFGDMHIAQATFLDGGNSKGKSFNKVEHSNTTVLPSVHLKDNEVKKSNELVPTTLHVRTILVNENNENQGAMDFVVGIKTTMHAVSSEEIISNMINAVKNNNKFFNMIRWTSGEISFFKDFLFNISEMKNDVANRSAGSSPWWISLKRRRSMAKIKMIGNQILPNASIVVSMEEVEYLKTEYGIDLLNSATIRKIMERYFLLSFVVVDNSTQIAHFFFDGQKEYQEVTYNSLEREASKGVEMKEVMKIINRANM